MQNEPAECRMSVINQDSPGETVSGCLRARFAQADSGESRMVERFRSGLFHFGKPYWDGRQLVVQVVNPTAGIFERDTLDSRIQVGGGSRVCILSPSSTQVYNMPNGIPAKSLQRITIDGSGELACIPKWTALHRDAVLHQSTEIDLERESGLFYVDPVSAGRIGFGEFLQFRELVSSISIRLEGKLILKERFVCGRDINPWIWNGNGRLNTHYACVYLYRNNLSKQLERLFLSVSNSRSDVSFGMTCLSDSFVVLRLLGHGCVGIESMLREIYQKAGELFPVSPVVSRIN